MSPVNALFVPQPFLFICILILAKSPSRAPFKGSPSLLQAYEINNKIIDEINDDDDDDDIQFPQPLTPVDRALRASRFWSSAVPVIFNYYSTYTKLNLLNRLNPLLNRPCLTDSECEIIWSDLHASGASVLESTINDLKGFYVKTGQIIASRQDLFPREYTEALSGLTDYLDPMSVQLVRKVVERELCLKGERFEEVFREFDEIPLGAASVAQVHRARLTSKYGGHEVAVKVQRPGIEQKLLGDIKNLIALAKPLRGVKEMPVDYYVVFKELEDQLADEFDFVAEAAAMDRIWNHLIVDPRTGEKRDVPLRMPRPIPELVTRRVLVMDYLEGVPLSRAAEEMRKKGIDPDGPEAKIFGEKLLRSLTDVFSRCILESGFFHADPHPGNIFVLSDGSIGLIDFGQVKQISGRAKNTLAKVMVALDDRVSDTNPEDLETIGNLALELGVELREDAKPEGPAAVAMWLFDGSVKDLPGGYDYGELSPNSPVKELKSFPQDLVLVGRSTVLLKGLSSRLNIPWSLSAEWAPVARQVLAGSGSKKVNRKVTLKDVGRLVKSWGKGKVERGANKLPKGARRRLAAAVVWARGTRRSGN
ncbi:hypothetical protein TrVE_jg8381 [Triparma verrucosa]|uniref:Protein kinase domain-containing protein n=1 Tax=Triparma verrucosa TaxID=1606542 RepID=A0A9W7F8E8_9STRA|nr:hypothetical protein TrVE_jg8381 [Triparma verrucosa]